MLKSEFTNKVKFMDSPLITEHRRSAYSHYITDPFYLLICDKQDYKNGAGEKIGIITESIRMSRDEALDGKYGVVIKRRNKLRRKYTKWLKDCCGNKFETRLKEEHKVFHT